MAEKDIKVETYQDVAFDGAWKARSRGMWGIAATGLLLGAAVGLAAPLFPVLVAGSGGFTAAMATATSAMLPSMAIFGASGMATGMMAGALNGSAAGAAASVAKEAERRDLIRTKTIEEATGLKIMEPEVPALAQPEQRYFNPKVSATFAVLGAIAGAVMAAAFFASGVSVSSAAIPAISLIAGKAASDAAITACFVGVMSCFGAIFGVNVPKIGGDMQNFAGKLLSGEALGSSWNKEPENTISQSVSNPQVQQASLETSCPECTTNHAEKLGERRQPIVSYKEWVVSQPAEANPALARS